MNSILDESRFTSDSYQSETAAKVEVLTQNLQLKTKEISRLEEIEEKQKILLKEQTQ